MLLLLLLSVPSVHIEVSDRRTLVGNLIVMAEDVSAGETLFRSCIDNDIGYSRESRHEQLQDVMYCSTRSCSCSRCLLEEVGVDLFVDRVLAVGDADESRRIIKSVADLLVMYDDAALYLYRKLIERDPHGSADIYYTLGSALIEVGRWSDAYKAFEEGFEAHPNHTELTNLHKVFTSYESFSYSNMSATSNSHDLFHCIRLQKKAGRDVVNVYLTKSTVLSRMECNKIITRAEEHARGSGGWTHHRHKAYPTSDIPVHFIPDVLDLFNSIMKSKILPMIAGMYSQYVTIRVHDAFIVKYSVDNQRYLPQHYDQSTHSFILPLNSHHGHEGEGDFVGGGTLFGRSLSIVPRSGEMLLFPGKDIYHGGDVLLKGERYILAVFLMMIPSNNSSSSAFAATSKQESFSFDFF